MFIGRGGYCTPLSFVVVFGESEVVDVIALKPSSLDIDDPSFLDVPPHHPRPQLFVGYQVLWIDEDMAHNLERLRDVKCDRSAYSMLCVTNNILGVSTRK